MSISKDGQSQQEQGRPVEEVVVDLECVSILEQERILRQIEDAKFQHAKQLSASFARTRQRGIASFFR